MNGRQMEDGSYKEPACAVLMNLSKPRAGRQKLLGHFDLQVLVHELGHVFQQTLTEARYSRLAGNNVALDFLETPSKVMEQFIWQPGFLKKISGHYKKSSKKLPDELISGIIEARNIENALGFQKRVTKAMLDIKCHTGEIRDIEAEVQQLYSSSNLELSVSATQYMASFWHIMGGYAAGYYSYPWSSAHAQYIFSRFMKEGITNPKTGKDFRQNILAPSATVNPWKLITRFLGSELGRKVEKTESEINNQIAELGKKHIEGHMPKDLLAKEIEFGKDNYIIQVIPNTGIEAVDWFLHIHFRRYYSNMETYAAIRAKVINNHNSEYTLDYGVNKLEKALLTGVDKDLVLRQQRAAKTRKYQRPLMPLYTADIDPELEYLGFLGHGKDGVVIHVRKDGADKALKIYNYDRAELAEREAEIFEKLKGIKYLVRSDKKYDEAISLKYIDGIPLWKAEPQPPVFYEKLMKAAKEIASSGYVITDFYAGDVIVEKNGDPVIVDVVDYIEEHKISREENAAYLFNERAIKNLFTRVNLSLLDIHERKVNTDQYKICLDTMRGIFNDQFNGSFTEFNKRFLLVAELINKTEEAGKLDVQTKAILAAALMSDKDSELPNLAALKKFVLALKKPLEWEDIDIIAAELCRKPEKVSISELQQEIEISQSGMVMQVTPNTGIEEVDRFLLRFFNKFYSNLEIYSAIRAKVIDNHKSGLVIDAGIKELEKTLIESTGLMGNRTGFHKKYFERNKKYHFDHRAMPVLTSSVDKKLEYVRILGHGTEGTVVLVRKDGKYKALKLYHSNRYDKASKEAEVLKELKDVKNVVNLDKEYKNAISMEYIKGISLRKAKLQSPSFYEKLLKTALEIADKGYDMQDFLSVNGMVAENGDPYVIDVARYEKSIHLGYNILENRDIVNNVFITMNARSLGISGENYIHLKNLFNLKYKWNFSEFNERFIKVKELISQLEKEMQINGETKNILVSALMAEKDLKLPDLSELKDFMSAHKEPLEEGKIDGYAAELHDKSEVAYGENVPIMIVNTIKKLGDIDPNSRLLKELIKATGDSYKQFLTLLKGIEEENILNDWDLRAKKLDDQVVRLKKAVNIEVKVSNQDLRYLLQREDIYGLASIEIVDGKQVLIVHEVVLEALRDRGPPEGHSVIGFLKLLLRHEKDEYRSVKLKKNKSYNDYLSERDLRRGSQTFHEYLKFKKSNHLDLLKYKEEIIKQRYIRDFREVVKFVEKQIYTVENLAVLDIPISNELIGIPGEDIISDTILGILREVSPRSLRPYQDHPHYLVADIAKFIFDRFHNKGAGDIDLKELLPTNKYNREFGSKFLPEFDEDMEKFLDKSLPNKIKHGDKTFYMKSVGAGRGIEAAKMGNILYKKLKEYGENPQDWDVVIEAYDKQVMSCLTISNREGYAHELSGHKVPANSEVMDWIKPVYIDLTDKNQVKMIKDTPADIIFCNNTLKYITNREEFKLIENTLVKSVRKDVWRWLMIKNNIHSFISDYSLEDVGDGKISPVQRTVIPDDVVDKVRWESRNMLKRYQYKPYGMNISELITNAVEVLEEDSPDSELIQVLKSGKGNLLAALLKGEDDSAVLNMPQINERGYIGLLRELKGNKYVDDVKISGQDTGLVLYSRDIFGLATMEVIDGKRTLIIHESIFQALKKYSADGFDTSVKFMNALADSMYEEDERSKVLDFVKKIIHSEGVSISGTQKISKPTSLHTEGDRLDAVHDRLLGEGYIDIAGSGEGVILDIGSGRPDTAHRFADKIWEINKDIKVYAVDRVIPKYMTFFAGRFYYYDENGKHIKEGNKSLDMNSSELEEKFREFRDDKNKIVPDPYEKEIEGAKNMGLVKGEFSVPRKSRPGGPVKMITCFNTLVYYSKKKAMEALNRMGRMLEEGGVLAEGITALKAPGDKLKWSRFVVLRKEKGKLNPVEFLISPESIKRILEGDKFRMPAYIESGREWPEILKIFESAKDLIREGTAKQRDIYRDILGQVVEELNNKGLSASLTSDGYFKFSFQAGKLFKKEASVTALHSGQIIDLIMLLGRQAIPYREVFNKLKTPGDMTLQKFIEAITEGNISEIRRIGLDNVLYALMRVVYKWPRPEKQYKEITKKIKAEFRKKLESGKYSLEFTDKLEIYDTDKLFYNETGKTSLTAPFFYNSSRKTWEFHISRKLLDVIVRSREGGRLIQLLVDRELSIQSYRNKGMDFKQAHRAIRKKAGQADLLSLNKRIIKDVQTKNIQRKTAGMLMYYLFSPVTFSIQMLSMMIWNIFKRHLTLIFSIAVLIATPFAAMFLTTSEKIVKRTIKPSVSWVTEKGDTRAGQIRTEFETPAPGKARLKFEIPSIRVWKDTVNGIAGTLMSYPGEDQAEGSLIRRYIAVPQDVKISDIELETIVSDSLKFADSRLNPEQSPDADSVYAGNFVKINGIEKIRDQTVVSISISPLHYNAEKNEYRAYNEFQIDMSYPAGRVGVPMGTLGEVARHIILNYNIPPSMPSRTASVDVSYPTNLKGINTADFLIITPDVFHGNDDLERFAKFRSEFSNLNVTIVNTRDIYNQFPADSCLRRVTAQDSAWNLQI